MPYYKTPINYPTGRISQDTAKINENFTELAKAFVNEDPTTYTVVNADKVDNYHASQTPSANTIPVSDNTGKLNLNWIPQGSGSGLNADQVDGFHASQTPSANTIPVAGANGKLDAGWLPTISSIETYSRLTVGTSLPTSPQHNDLFYNTSNNTLQRYDARTNTWTTIDWQTIVRASPEWQARRLRINSSTGRLEISPDGTNWYECIPAVGVNTIELATVDNVNFNFKYWIMPGQIVIVRNSNHLPVISIPQNVFDVRMRIVSSSAVNDFLLWPGNISSTSYHTEIWRNDSAGGSSSFSLTGHRIGWGGAGLYTSFSQFSIIFNNNTVETTGSFKFYGSTYGLLCFSNHSAYSSSIYWLGTVRNNLSGNPLNNFEIATITRRA